MAKQTDTRRDIAPRDRGVSVHVVRSGGIAGMSRRWQLEAFGDDVIEHYLHAAEIELAEFNSAITDWERKRGYERL